MAYHQLQGPESQAIRASKEISQICEPILPLIVALQSGGTKRTRRRDAKTQLGEGYEQLLQENGEPISKNNFT